MAAENIIGALFAVGFGGFFILMILWGIAELFGRVYGTYRVFIREDLISEQRLIYLLLIWFVPIGWLIYFILGTEKTRELFNDLDFL